MNYIVFYTHTGVGNIFWIFIDMLHKDVMSSVKKKFDPSNLHGIVQYCD